MHKHTNTHILNITYHETLVANIAHVEQLSSKRENTVTALTNHTHARNGGGLGGVSLRQNQCALVGVLAA